jgi:hypothetical protein
MADAPTPHTGGKGIGGFLNQSTAGLPNWAWLAVVGAGIAAALFLPKILGGKSQGANAPTSGTGTTPDTSGLGLAVDPTTGLPYAVEGLQSSGGLAGTQTTPAPPTTTTPAPANPTFTTVKSGALETAPRDVHGKTLTMVPSGANVQLLSGPPIPDPAGGSKLYYPVSYNGQSGYVGSDVIHINAGSTGRSPLSWPTSYARSRHYRSAS